MLEFPRNSEKTHLAIAIVSEYVVRIMRDGELIALVLEIVIHLGAWIVGQFLLRRCQALLS